MDGSKVDNSQTEMIDVKPAAAKNVHSRSTDSKYSDGLSEKKQGTDSSRPLAMKMNSRNQTGIENRATMV